ncbi:MAG: molybdopterin-dependent oxidoreductase, partial [Calditerrivibrio sp.]|nr:molybdopterin-dependent oxidoreductase [Calditerrivibrio sp.]
MKFFICTKDCIEACHLKIDDSLQFYTEKRFAKYPFVCGKLRNFLKKEIFSNEASFYSEHSKKFTTSFTEITSRVSKKLQSLKDKKILYLRGSGSIGYMNYAWDILMSHLPNVYFIDGSICLSTGEDAHLEDFGVVTNPPISNLESVDNIILFGRDAWNVAPHLYSYLKSLKKKGKNIVYIDPIISNTQKISTDYIKIKPATDAHLIVAILQKLKLIKTENSIEKLLNISGISYNDFETSLKYISNNNTGIITGFGLQRYSNGKNIVQWINRLAYLTDNIDNLYYDRGSKYGLPKRLINNPRINISEILTKLEDNFFDASVIVSSNPLVSYPSTKRLKDAFSKLNT